MERIWIYQADRFLTDAEQQRILQRLEAFTGQWRAHGKELAAHAEIRHQLFIIITVDESVAPPTGCSIDKSVHLLKDLEQELGVGLLDRTTIAFKRDKDSPLELASRTVFQELINAGEVGSESFVFNNLVTTYQGLTHDWEVPLHRSWHAKVFDNVPYTA